MECPAPRDRLKQAKNGPKWASGAHLTRFLAKFFQKNHEIYSIPPMVTKPFLIDRKAFEVPLNSFVIVLKHNSCDTKL